MTLHALFLIPLVAVAMDDRGLLGCFRPWILDLGVILNHIQRAFSFRDSNNPTTPREKP